MALLLKKQMKLSNDIIVIDEASQLSDRMVDYIYRCADNYNKSIVLVGDWAQAAPVNGAYPFDTEFFKQAKHIRLTECHRQKDLDFVNALVS